MIPLLVGYNGLTGSSIALVMVINISKNKTKSKLKNYTYI